MAEKPQLRIADQDHFSDDDPFAELTRIMGFDPRVPVQREPGAAAGEPESSAAHNAVDDFGIDLEKELMGEFAAEDSGDANVRSIEPTDEYQPEEPSYVGESAGYEAAAEPGATDDETVAPAEFEPVVDFEPATPEASTYEAHDFDSAFASSMEHELSLDGDWVAAEEASAEVEPVYFEGAEEQVEPAAGDDHPAAEYEQVDYPDSSIQADAYQEPQPVYQEPEPVYETAQEEFAPEGNWVEADNSHVSGQADEHADEFDAALAEVDMDFTAIPLGSVGRSEADLDAELRQDAVEEFAPVADAGPSLEDELNALLGNLPAHEEHSASGPLTMEDHVPSVEVEAEAEVQDGQDGDVDMAVAADEFVTAAPVAMEAPAHETPVDRSYARSNYRAEDLAYTTPVSDVAHVEGHAAESADADIDLGFDDEAFDAAFADSIESEQPAYDSEPAADEQEQPARADADPYSDLASLTAQFVPTGPVSSWREQSPQPAEYAVQYGEADYAVDDGQGAAAAYDDIPDIETVEVPEQAVALSDDLDIPEVVYEDEPTPSPAYDDIDAEFANLLNDMNSPEPSSVASSNEAADEAVAADKYAEERADYVADFAYPAAAAAGAVAAGAAAYGQHQPMTSRRNDFDGQDFGTETTHAGYRQPIADDLDYDPDFDEEMALPALEQERQRPQRRGMLIAAIVGGVAIIGGIGAFALSGGGADSQAPAIVKADDGPIKVRPENPGGTKVPNQDNQVYDAVSRTAGAAVPQPQQEKLVTSAEEPVDMAAQEPEPSEPELAQDAEADTPAPMAKSEDRIEQILDEGAVGADSGVPVVAPRKVRTMVVKADGTLVPREEPAPAVAAAQDTNATASETMVEPSATTLSSESTAAVPASSEAPAEQANAEPVPAEAGAAPEVAQPQQSSTTPNSVAVAPTRPSDQPVDVVGEVKADKVAALAPAAAGGGWSMQIASQPSEAAAQSSYQDLLRRYGSVLNGHQANIVKAEIAGKGTFWRVRVPAETRNDAIKLCESYKAAGGNCFVSK